MTKLSEDQLSTYEPAFYSEAIRFHYLRHEEIVRLQ